MPAIPNTNVWGTVTCTRTDFDRLYWSRTPGDFDKSQMFDPKEPDLKMALAGTRVDVPRTIHFYGERVDAKGVVTHRSDVFARNFTRRRYPVVSPEVKPLPLDLSDLTFDIPLEDSDPNNDYEMEVAPA